MKVSNVMPSHQAFSDVVKNCPISRKEIKKLANRHIKNKFPYTLDFIKSLSYKDHNYWFYNYLMEGHKKDGSYVAIRQQIYVVQTPDGESHYEWSSIPYNAVINPEEVAIKDESDRVEKSYIINPLQAVKTAKKTGKEPFVFDGNEMPLNVLSFWQWSSSELLGNALRGVLAEFIVASTIDVLEQPREEWDAYDLITKSGLKIEIKSSAYLQSWNQTELSKIIFGIQPTVLWDENNKRSEEAKRQADVYVFCVLAHKDKGTVNPLDLSQWDFYVLDTKVLNDKVPKQKTITLSSLLKLNPSQIKYDGLTSEINKRQ
ncbi:hypothetical protein [Candidatus Thioglobus autotrophicus]|uniref:hypothetical protein n=1 Tax=Candidatus Thioglobus autotrophicus TaxID=1705394 RepID=UPI000AC08C23|nr:hypothetical protein [Candidatus Thioglobus autotrophicus]